MKLTVQTDISYPIYFYQSYNNLFEAFKEASLLNRKLCIVTDSNVAPLYLDSVKKALGDVPAFIFEAGEAQKHMGTLQAMYSFFLASKLDRRSIIVALGGGVTGDLAGFAAATFMRGIDFVQLPTSLLAQVDASVGGKTAIDFDNVKNLVGAFHQPKLVYINLATLNTLLRQEYISGMGEIVKHGLIGDNVYYQYLQDNHQAIQTLDPEVMLEVVAGSCRIKSAIVAQDEKESGLREILNFGHCVGHAVESLLGYALPHGQCIAIGMCVALQLSTALGHITSTERDQSISLMKDFELPVTLDANIELKPKIILSEMYKDKKTINDTLRLVLLKKIGDAYTDNTVSPKNILKALEYSFKKGSDSKI